MQISLNFEVAPYIFRVGSVLSVSDSLLSFLELGISLSLSLLNKCTQKRTIRIPKQYQRHTQNRQMYRFVSTFQCTCYVFCHSGYAYAFVFGIPVLIRMR